jgi:hypothetical protein
MTRCSTGRATQKYRGNGTDLSDILETPGDIIYADAAVSAENLVISGTTGDVLKVSASGIPEWGASTSQWITSGDDISYSLGHVGIGTTSPDANLHVTGNAFVSTDLGLGGTLTMGNVLVEALHELSAITATGNVTPHVIEFTNPTTGLVTTGNVGIGTSSPLETLDVYGGFLVRPERTTAFYDNAWTGTSPTNFTAGGPITGPTINVIYSKNAIYTTTGGLKVSPPNTDTEYYYERGFNFVYSPFGSYYTHFPASGSVTSPYLSGDVFSSTRFKADNTEDFTGFAIGQDYEAGDTLTDYSQNLDIARAHSAHMYFKTASSDGSLTEKMRITNAGNVGIGLTQPTTALDVSGTVKATAFEGDGSALTGIVTGQWTESSGDISYTTGRVGIGLTQPTTALDVSGTVKATAFEGDGSALTGIVTGQWTESSGDISYTTGRVGVGTSSPDANLHVEGNVYVSSNLIVGPIVLATPIVYQQQGKIQASDVQASDNFGFSVSLSGDGNTAIVGARREDTGGTDAGAAYIFTRSGGTWTQQQKIQASDAQAGDDFGNSVSISSDGNTALIGARIEDTNGTDAGAAYIFTRSGGTWTQQQKIQASDAQAYDYFGTSVSLSGDGNTAIVGANYEDTNGTDAGAAYIFTRSGGTWTQQQKIQASDVQGDDNFGYRVSLSSDGNTALISAHFEDTGATNAGAAYIFTRSNGTWTQQQKIQASDAQLADYFGNSVSLSSDGNTAIVGAYTEDTGGTSAGAAYVFTRSGGTWSQQQKIQASDAQGDDYFGYSVSLSSDGNTALIGASLEDTGGFDVGAAYIFTRSGGTWTQQQKFQASDAQSADEFSYSVSLSSDGNTALIGAHFEDTGGFGAGAAYIFTSTGGPGSDSFLCVDTTINRVGVGTSSPDANLHVEGNVYVSSNLEVGTANLFVDTVNSMVGVGTSTPDATLHVVGNAYVSSKLNVGPAVDGRDASGVEQQQKIQASDAQAYNYFGHSVSLSSDGNTALVGALEEDTGATRAGAAYIFIRSGGTWTQQQKIQASDPEANDYFGYSVSLSGDGNTALIGAYEDTGASDAGAAYIFTRSGGTWSQQQKIQASDAQAYDYFGYSVSLSSDGNTALIGARYEDTGATDAGAAYIFIRSGGTWTQQQKIQASDAETGDQFGYSVSLSGNGNTALIGARYEDTGATDAGAAYVFTRSGVTWSQQQKIQASDAQASDQFGYSVSLSSDGNTALIGARYKDTAATSAGAAYVFILSGGTWSQQQKIQASDPEASDYFGHSVSLSSDGNTALVGAFEEDTGATSAGAAYMFIRYSGTWTQQYKIQASDPETGDRFGYSVSLSSDGNTALIGARYEDTGATDAGAAYIFIRSFRTVLCADTTTSRVGVGTTSPNYTLDVAGDLTCSGTMRHRAFAFYAKASNGEIVASRGILSDSNSTITTEFDYTPAGTASTNGFRSSGGVSNNQGTYFAPVDGIYHVSCKVRLPNWSTTVQEIHWYIKRTNGNEVQWESFEMWISPPDGGGHRATMSSTIVKLAKDEGIFPRGDGPTTSLISATFGGHFLGTY